MVLELTSGGVISTRSSSFDSSQPETSFGRAIRRSVSGGSADSGRTIATQGPVGPTREDLEAQQAREKNLEEQRVKQQGIETQRLGTQQSLIQSRTLGGQLEKPSGVVSSAPPSLTFRQAVKESIGIGKARVTESFISRPRDRRESRSVFEPFGLVGDKARVGKLTKKQLTELKKADVGTPFVSRTIVREFEPGVSESELKRRVRQSGRKESIFESQLKQTTTQTQEKLISERDLIQAGISKGEFGLTEGERRLDIKTTELETQLQKETQPILSKEQKRREKEERRLGTITTTGKEVARGAPGVVELGLLGVGGASASVGIGIKELVSAEKSGSKGELALGTGLVALGGVTGLSGAVKQVRVAQSESLVQKGLGTRFREGQLGEVFLEREAGGISAVRGQRKLLAQEGRFTQKIEVGSGVIKRGDEFAVVGRGRSTIKLELEPTDIIGPLSKPQTVEFTQQFKPFGTFQGFPTQTEGVSGFIGRTGSETGGKIGDFQKVSGFTEKITPTTFRTTSGQLRKVALNTERPFATSRVDGSFVSVQKKIQPELLLDIRGGDVGITKVIKGTQPSRTIGGFDEFSGGGRLKGNLPSQSTTQVSTTSFAPQGLAKTTVAQAPQQFTLPKVSPSITGKAPSSGLVTRTGGVQTTTQVQRDIQKGFTSQALVPRQGVRDTFSTSQGVSVRTADIFKTRVATTPRSGVAQFSQPKLRELTGQGLGLETAQTFRSPQQFQPGISTTTTFGDFGFVPFFPPLKGLGGIPPRKKPTRGKKKKKVKIRTSFAGSTLGIKGLPRAGKFGITPFQIRGLPG